MTATQAPSTKKSRMTTAIRFPEDLHERLREAAESFGLPINFIVVKAMEEFLDQMNSVGSITLTRRPA